MLKIKRLVPDYIIINLSIGGFNPDSFLAALEEMAEFRAVQMVAYGEYSDYDKIKSRRISAFLHNESSYTEMRKFLQKIFSA